MSRNPAVPGSRPPQLAWAADDDGWMGMRRRSDCRQWWDSSFSRKRPLDSLVLHARESRAVNKTRSNVNWSVGTLLPELLQGCFQTRWLWIPGSIPAAMKDPRPQTLRPVGRSDDSATVAARHHHRPPAPFNPRRLWEVGKDELDAVPRPDRVHMPRTWDSTARNFDAGGTAWCPKQEMKCRVLLSAGDLQPSLQEDTQDETLPMAVDSSHKPQGNPPMFIFSLHLLWRKLGSRCGEGP